ncbi:uncharacterized protein At4g00950 [Punica granatum]|uniref:Uncharacterized protein n=2 Tax=Punica granatum TaxID=22663 RepID=A0A218WUA0_PUNGR|nr:uncharacterized protein At4g00950 [Punica granatum]OWM75542.1 hypothetical protein CDL15_Pgr021706 [Punica granatum]PKI76385.1 hypothetical protein CRG98_003180 [Punica granatum]
MKLDSHISIVLEADEGKRKEMGPLSDDHLQQDQAGKEDATTPKLSLFSLPRKPPEPPGMVTPPLNTTVSVPFQWEEAPGRPRPSCTRDSKPTSARCLELPPRLLNEAKVTNMPSPTTVLDGPYVGRSLSNTWSFRIGGSFRSPDGVSKKSSEVKDKVLLFSSTRWAPLIKEKSGAGGAEEANDDPFSILEEASDGFFGGTAGAEPKAKITRVKRRGSLLSLSHGKSHLWASIYESIKQVVPWRRRQRKSTVGDVHDHDQERPG